jgi:hypothetical protein
MTRLAPAAHRHVRWLALCAYLFSMTGWASHYTGTYADADGAVVEITHDAQGNFTGRLQTEQGTFTLSGYATDDLGGEGVIEAGPDRIPFDVALSGDGATLTLVLRANGARYTFQRQPHGTSSGGAHHGAEPPRTEARPDTATTDPYLGSFRDAQIAVVLEGGGGRYTGRIEANGDRYPVQLEASGQELVGTFQVGPDRFDVRMALQGETLVVRTGGATYHLARQPSGSDGAVASTGDVPAVLESLHLRPVTIMDETGFSQPVPALTLMVPHDWTAEGAVLWNPRLSCVTAPQAYYQTASPDETFRIATTAMESWTVANFPMPPQPDGCIPTHVDGVRGYLEAWVARERPGARTMEVRDRPDLAAPYAGLHVDDPATGLRIWVEAGEITYAFEHRGVAVEERLAAVVITVESLSRSADGSVLGYQARTAFGHVVRAPAGQLGPFAVLADTVLRLVRADPQWQAAIAAHLRQLAGDHMDTAVAIHHIRMEAQGYVFDLSQQSAADRAASSDRADARFSETIRGTRQYFDPVTNGPVELPDYFDFVWRLEDGSYRFTNDALIVPFRDWGLDGQLIERMP